MGVVCNVMNTLGEPSWSFYWLSVFESLFSLCTFSGVRVLQRFSEGKCPSDTQGARDLCNLGVVLSLIK